MGQQAGQSCAVGGGEAWVLLGQQHKGLVPLLQLHLELPVDREREHVEYGEADQRRAHAAVQASHAFILDHAEEAVERAAVVRLGLQAHFHSVQRMANAGPDHASEAAGEDVLDAPLGQDHCDCTSAYRP